MASIVFDWSAHGSSRRRLTKKTNKPPRFENTFYARTQHLRARLRQLQIETEPLTITVKRENLFEDSLNLVGALDANTLTGRLSIKFEGEKGLDYGGMSREWFLELSKEILSPERGLFVMRGKQQFVINPGSKELPDWRRLFSFVGTVLGMAVFHGKIFPSYFAGPFYKHLCEDNAEFSDLKEFDESIYKSLKYILDTPDCTEDMELDFTLTEQYVVPSNTPGGPVSMTPKVRLVELMSGATETAVTEENKAEYVKLAWNHYLNSSSVVQMDAIKESFYQFCPKNVLKEIFTWKDLPELIGGCPEINVEEMRQYTECRGFAANSPVITWFWEIVLDMSQEDLKLFLKFVTGTDKVPVGGFEFLYGSNGLQRLTLNKLSKKSGLPAAHSCFNRLDLPEYPSKTLLSDSLLYAIRESQTFDIE